MFFYRNDLLFQIYQQGIKQPCETKEKTKMIVFGKLENEGIASATPLYVQENVKFLVKPGTGCFLADWRDFKTTNVWRNQKR